MELVIQAAGACLVCALLGSTLRRGSPEISLVLAAVGAAVVLLALTEPLGELVGFLKELTAGTGLPAELFRPLYKTVGIALVVKIGGSLCQDAGEGTLAAVLGMTGTVCALLAALPLLRGVLNLLLELI